MKRLALILVAAAVLCGCGSYPVWKRQDFAFITPADSPLAHAPTNIVALTRVSVSPLFQSRSFTYRTADNAYEQDAYAGFLVPPDRAVAEPIRAWMRAGGVLGGVVEAGSGLPPNLVVEATVNELYGDFRNKSQPLGAMAIHFVIYEASDGAPGRLVLDKICERATPLARKTPAALMAAWDADLREIMEDLDSDYAKAHFNDGGR